MTGRFLLRLTGIGRPAGPKEANLLQGLKDLFQCLLSEVGDREEVGAGAVQQVVDGKNPFLLQTVGGPHRQPDISRAHLELFSHLVALSQIFIRNAWHGVPPVRSEV